MKVLVAGGAGYVAGLTLPMLAERHSLRIFDRRSPEFSECEYVQGEISDFEALAKAASGCEALLYMAMGKYYPHDAQGRVHPEFLTGSLEANVKGLSIALHAVHAAGVSHAVYTSSMSVYGGHLEERYFPNEEVPPDAQDTYGFTKLLGEEVCRNACSVLGMSVNVLRLCLPMPLERWQQRSQPTIATASNDVAQALLAALEYRDGLQAFMISGDYEQKIMNMAKAERRLGWKPLARPAPSEKGLLT